MQHSHALYIRERIIVSWRGDVPNGLLLWIANIAPTGRQLRLQHAVTRTCGLGGDANQ